MIDKYSLFKGAVGRIVKIQDLAKKFEHRQLLSPSPHSAKALNGLLSPSPHKGEWMRVHKKWLTHSKTPPPHPNTQDGLNAAIYITRALYWQLLSNLADD